MNKKNILALIMSICIFSSIAIEPMTVYSAEENISMKDEENKGDSWIEIEMKNNEPFIKAIENATKKSRENITKDDLKRIKKLIGGGASDIPDKIDDLENLVELDFSGGTIEKVPNSVGNLKNLEKINLNQNNLQEFPNAVLRLPKLKNLWINKGNIKEIPETIIELQNTLINLDIRFQNLVEIPEVLLDVDKWPAASKVYDGMGLGLDITDNQISQPYTCEINAPFSSRGNLLGESQFEKPSYGIKQDQLYYSGKTIEIPIGTNIKAIEVPISDLFLSSGHKLFENHIFEVGVDSKSDYKDLFEDGVAKTKGKTNIFIKTIQASSDNMKARAVVPVEIIGSNDKPIISGADNCSIKEGDIFDPMAGVTAEDTEDGNITKDIKVIGEVNTNKPGKYEITYEVTDSDGNKTMVKRIVTVNPKWSDLNSVPTINGAENKTIKVSDIFNPLDGITANDKEDGDITKNIKVIENTVDTSKTGTYKVVYEVTDSKGAKTTKTITIIVRSNDKPVISGADNCSIKEGDIFDPMAGVTAEDTEDGNI
ncbi:immunoglobulin-like domain-containing protein, partial [Clostridium sp.]|uniref:immunoglobulin-like domain-containing protein n=1 Tax=Clostridium sp. TaxID=1506 RepID=UPI002FCA6194